GLLEDRDSLVAVHRFCVMMMPTARSIRAGGHRGAEVLLGLMMAGQASRDAGRSTPDGPRTPDGPHGGWSRSAGTLAVRRLTERTIDDDRSVGPHPGRLPARGGPAPGDLRGPALL